MTSAGRRPWSACVSTRAVEDVPSASEVPKDERRAVLNKRERGEINAPVTIERNQAMTEERRRILNMMSEGKLSAVEAEALLDALASNSSSQIVPARTQLQPPATQSPKYLRVLVESEAEGKPSKVNVRVPFELIRAGMRLAALIPVVAYEPVNRALKDAGVDLDISKIKAEDLEGLAAHLQELQVDVDDGAEKVRVFCE